MDIEAFFKISYGLYVVGSVNNGKLNGYIGNTVFQVTAEPPQFAIACNKENYTAEFIRQSNVFSVSILRIDAKSELIGIFGYKSGNEIDKFSYFKHKFGKTGAPILLEDTISWFECEVVQTVDVGSHLIFIGQVVDSELVSKLDEPLTYAYYREIKKGKAPKNAPTYVDPAKIASAEAVESETLYYCPACGYIYYPDKGDPDSGIAPGTRFEDIPEDWICPICGTSKEDFVPKQ